MDLKNPLKMSRPNRVQANTQEKVEAFAISNNHLDKCPKCGNEMEIVSVSPKKIQSYVCYQDRIAFPVENR